MEIRVRPLILTITVWLPFLSSCATLPDREERIAAFRRAEPQETIPRLILVEVNLEEESLYGDKTTWTDDIVSVLCELQVCSEVRCHRGARGEAVPDATVRVDVRRATPVADAAEIQAQGAFLATLAWSVFPPIAWWIDDVDVDPRVEILVAMTGAGRDAGTPGPEEQDSGAELIPAIQTHYTDRHPLVSWASLGALIIPSFIFDDGNEEHLREELAPRIRFEAAMIVADLLRKGSWNKGLIETLGIDSARRLHVQGGPELARIVWRWGRESGERSFKLAGPHDLQWTIPEAFEGGRIRVEAFDRRGRSELFSAWVNSGEARRDSPGNGLLRLSQGE